MVKPYEIITDYCGNTLYAGPPRESIKEALGKNYEKVLSSKSTLFAYFLSRKKRTSVFCEEIRIEKHEYVRIGGKFEGGEQSTIELMIDQEFANVLKKFSETSKRKSAK